MGQSVLVVGAGPTGLTLANALAAYRVPFTIVDRKPGPTQDSKALAINVATQYGLELIGLDSTFKDSGCRVQRLNVLWRGRRFSAVDFRHLDFHLREFITQPQSDTEERLIEVLAKRDIRVEWQTRLIDITQSANGVEAVLQDVYGRCRTMRYAYAVGCDGKNSVVRPRVGAVFSGHDYPMYFALGDFELNWNGRRDQVYYHVYDDTFFIFVPVNATHWRVVVKHDGAIPDATVQPSEITDVVARYLGPDVFRGDPIWISRAPFYMRIADRLRHGKLFLAGDAAHLYSPIGGTGMNTGMQDALNLAWKLACCFHGLAHDALLDTYESERLEAIKAGALATDKSTRLIGRMDCDMASLGQWLPTMSNRDALRSQLPFLHSGLALAYPKSFDVTGGAAFAGSQQAGRLCLGFGRLLSLLKERDGQLPVLIGVVRLREGSTVAILPQLREIQRITAEYRGVVRWMVFVPDSVTRVMVAETFPDMVVCASDSDLLARVGVGPGALTLIMPDGIIGFSGSVTDTNGAQAMLEQRFGATPSARGANGVALRGCADQEIVNQEVSV